MRNIVTLPYDPVWRALDWAKDNCPSYITNDVHTKEQTNTKDSPVYIEHYINYYFSDPKDAMWFALRWS